MLNITSTPTNPEILKEDAGMIKKYAAIILLCVLYQIATEFSFFYSIFSTNLSHLYGGRFLSFVFSGAFTLIIEGLGIASLIYVVVSILEKRYSFSIRFLMPLFTCVICYAASCSISYHGVPQLVNKFTAAPTLSSTIKIDSTLNIEQKGINKTYSNDSTLIRKNYLNQFSSLATEYKSLIDFQKAEKRKYEKQKKKGSKWAQSWIDKTESKILKLKSERAKKKSELVKLESNELTALLMERKENINTGKSSYKTEKEKITNDNKTLTDHYKGKLSTQNQLYRFGVFFTLLLIVLGTTYILNSKHKAGIKTHSQVNQYFFEESIFDKLHHLIVLKFNIWAHGAIDKRLTKLKPPTPSEKPMINNIYQKVDFTKYVNPYDIDETQQNLNIAATVPTVTKKIKVAPEVPPVPPVAEINPQPINRHTETVRDGDGSIKRTGTGTDKRNGDGSKGTDKRDGYKSVTGTVEKNGDGSETGTVEVIIKEIPIDKDLIECAQKDCKESFAPFPKHKKFCSTKCRKRHFKDVNGYEPYMKKRK